MTVQRRVTKIIQQPVIQPPKTLDEKAADYGIVEVVNTQRGRDQSIGWAVYRKGKVYIVGTTKRHALLNLAQEHKILNLPR